MKKLTYIILLSVSFASFGQTPIINSISPTHAEVGQTVTISGSNLGGRVFFGGVEAPSVNVITGNLIEATVPAGATQGSLTVLNNSLVAQSSQHFYISFSGSTSDSYSIEYELSSGESDANDICLCDLDGDDLNDVAMTHNVSADGKGEASIYHNQSTLAGLNPLFSKLTNINNAESGFAAVTCADLDNDGKPELIFTTNNGLNARQIYVYRNQSTVGNINMTDVASVNLRLPPASSGNRVPRRVRIADMDGDGKNDLVIGNRTDETLHIYRNTSAGIGNFSFDTEVEIDSDGEFSGLLELADFNGDGRTDIVSMPFRETGTRIHILKNNSIEGTLKFEIEASLTNGGQTNGVSVGDFDDDGLIDIVVASNSTGQITTFRNSTAGADITFDAGENLSITDTTPFGVTVGDLNGDGKLDIASAFGAGNIYVFENNSSSGNISFTADEEITTLKTTQNVVIGDLNGDARPDIAFTADVAANGPIGKLGVFLNRNCMTPVLTPSATGTSFCDTPDTFTLTATASPGASYTWASANNIGTGGTNFSTGTTNSATFEISGVATATVRVTITSADGLCTTEFDEEVYNLENASGTSDPTINISQTGVLCAGDDAILSTAATYESYLWTLPNGSTRTTATINLASVSPEDAGVYSVSVRNTGNCTSDVVTQNVEVAQPPSLQILNNDDDTFCDDGTNDPLLEVSNIAGLSYQWQRNGSDISPETGVTYRATQSGDYTVEVTDGNGCMNETPIFTVTELSEPISTFTGDSETCVGFETTFTATGSVDAGFINSWLIEDATNTTIHMFTGNELVFTFPTSGTYEVMLTTSYEATIVSACSTDATPMSITISDAPTITFSIPDNSEKCELDALTVGITSPTNIDVYQWSVINAFDLTEISTSTDPTINATTPVGVDSIYAVATITTAIGCTVKDSVLIKNFVTDADISSALFDLANDSVTLEDANSIVLTAENLVSNIAWSPASIIDDTTTTSVTVFPANSPSVVTVSGIDTNGCGVTSTVTIILDNVRPRRTFSPNGDGQGFDCWEILNTSELVGCKVYVFDSRGKNILVADSPFDNNCVWDGNYNGTPVPEGLYYFVLKCDDTNLSKSGSILLAR